MAGNVACAVHAAVELGSMAFGMFIKPQNTLHCWQLTSEEVSAFKKALVVCIGLQLVLVASIVFTWSMMMMMMMNE